jgi:MYXO-CTERM domain-containing protein
MLAIPSRAPCFVAVVLFSLLTLPRSQARAEFPVVEQEQQNWCWAACSKSILQYYGAGSTTRQCDMANYAFGLSTCCSEGTWDAGAPCDQGAPVGSSSGNRLWPTKNAQGVLKRFGDIRSKWLPRAATASELLEQVKTMRPWIIARFTVASGHGTVGSDFDGTNVTFMDPWPTARDTVKSYAYLLNGDGYSWGETLLTKIRGLTFVIDDTGSMSDNIDAAKAAAKAVIDENTAAGRHFLYTVVTFKDGPSTLRGQTMYPDEAKTLIDALSATGGDGCPESSLTAIRESATLVPHSDIYLMTDANSNSYGVDYTYAGVVEVFETVAVMIKNDVTVNPIVFGDCSASYSVAKAFSVAGSDPARQPGCGMKPKLAKMSTASATASIDSGVPPTPPIDSGVDGYAYLSRVTGGLFFNIGLDSTAPVTDMLLKHASMDATLALYDGAGPAAYSVPVDASVTAFEIVLNSSGTNTLEVKNPAGVVVTGSTTGVEVSTVGSNAMYTITGAALSVGSWTATVSGDGTYRLSSVAATPNDFDYDGATTAGLGATLTVKAGLVNPVPGAAFSLIGTGGSSDVALSLFDDGAHDDGYDGDAYYAGTVVMNQVGSYRLMVAGDGYFQRVNRALITVGTVDVVAPTDTTVGPGTTLTHRFQVKNLGSAQDTYGLHALSSLGWAQVAGVPSTVTVGAGATQNVDITVIVPSEATAGQVDVLSLQAVSQADVGTNDTASVQTIVATSGLDGGAEPDAALGSDVQPDAPLGLDGDVRRDGITGTGGSIIIIVGPSGSGGIGAGGAVGTGGAGTSQTGGAGGTGTLQTGGSGGAGATGTSQTGGAGATGTSQTGGAGGSTIGPVIDSGAIADGAISPTVDVGSGPDLRRDTGGAIDLSAPDSPSLVGGEVMASSEAGSVIPPQLDGAIAIGIDSGAPVSPRPDGGIDTAAAPIADASTPTPAGGSKDSGCGCHVGAARSNSSFGLLFLLLAALGGLRLRRRH